MHRVCLPFALSALLLQPPGSASSTETEKDAATTANQKIDAQAVRKLIDQLGSSKRQERVQAEKALQELGEPVLDLLPSPDLLRNVSARQAVRRIRVRVEHDIAVESVRPSRVTLDDSRPVHEIVALIAKQTGNHISTERLSEADRSRRITIRGSGITFWQAVRIIESHGFAAQFNPENGELELTATTRRPSEADEPRAAPSQPAVIEGDSGSFRIRCRPAVSRPVPGSGYLLTLAASLECEPRLRPLFLRYRSEDLSLQDLDSVLPPFDPGAKFEVPLGISGRRSIVSPRRLATDQPESVRLQGTVSVLTAAAERPIVFSQLGRSRGVTRRRGGVSVTVTRSRVRPVKTSSKRKFEARVEARVNYDVGANAFESHQTWVFHNRVFLTTADGKTIAPSGFSTLFQADGSVGVEYLFEELPVDPSRHSLTYVAPTLLVHVPVKIDLDGIPVEKADDN